MSPKLNHPMGIILADMSKANPASRSQFVTRYYRTNLTVANAWASAFQLHNQTLNIWTHLLGAVYFIYMATNVWKFPNDPIDRFCVIFMVSSAIACFTFSTCYHTLLSVSDVVARRALVLDVLGIVSLILGSFVAGLRVGFYCSTLTASLYLVATAAMLGTAAAMMVVPSLRDNPALGPVRTAVLAGTVAWGLVPATHWILMAPDDMIIHAFTGLVTMFLLYAGGFMLFSLQLPERLSPGTFDLLFSSHQWWHVATVLAALVWTTHILLMYEEFLTENVVCRDGAIILL